jgi:hypothetical protein
MLIERKWKKWVYFYLPMAVFILFTLFPFYWMAVTAPAGQRAVPHLAAAERGPAVDARADAGALQGLAADHGVPGVALEHDADRDRLDYHLPHLRHVRGLRAGAPQVPRLGISRHRDFHHLPGAADAAFIQLADIIRDMQLGNTP